MNREAIHARVRDAEGQIRQKIRAVNRLLGALARHPEPSRAAGEAIRAASWARKRMRQGRDRIHALGARARALPGHAEIRDRCLSAIDATAAEASAMVAEVESRYAAASASAGARAQTPARSTTPAP